MNGPIFRHCVAGHAQIVGKKRGSMKKTFLFLSDTHVFTRHRVYYSFIVDVDRKLYSDKGRHMYKCSCTLQFLSYNNQTETARHDEVAHVFTIGLACSLVDRPKYRQKVAELQKYIQRLNLTF
jgi:hypothetical protein